MSLIYHNEILQNLNNNIDDRLYELILEDMTSVEQKIFVDSFKKYLQYGNDDTKFIINLEDILEWVGFSNKANAKTLLVKKFTENINYIYYKDSCNSNSSISIEDNNYKNISSKSWNKEIILLNISTFKKFCIKASTKKADEICDYYVKMENIMLQYTKEKMEEMKINYENAQNELSKYIEVDNGENNFWDENKISHYDDENVLYLAFIGIINGMRMYKFGKSEQVYIREFKQHKKNFDTFNIYHIEICDNMNRVEKKFGKMLESKNLIKKIKINDKNQTELFTVNSKFTIQMAVQNLQDLVIAYPLPAIKELKEINDKIIIENQDKEKIQNEKYDILLNENYELKNYNIEVDKTIKELNIKYNLKSDKLDEQRDKYDKVNEEYFILFKEHQELIKNGLINTSSNNSLTNEIIEPTITNIESTNEVVNTAVEVNITNIQDFFDRYTEFGEDTSSNDKYRITQQNLYDFYCEKCLQPIDIISFNIYIKETLKLECTKCFWCSKMWMTWMGIKLKAEFKRETKLDVYLRNFIESKCKSDNSAFIDTKIFNDTFKSFCEEHEDTEAALKYIGITPSAIKKSLTKFGYGYKEWIIDGKKHGYTGLTFNTVLTIKESMDKYIEDNCELSYGYKTKTTILWETYQEYNKKNNIYIKITRKQFYDSLMDDFKLTKKNITKKDIGFIGIKMKTIID